MQVYGADVTPELIYEALVEFKGHCAYLSSQIYVKFWHYLEDLLRLRGKSECREKLCHLKSIFVAGTVVPAKYEDLFLEALPNLKCVMNAYGQTEMCVLAMSPTTKMLGFLHPGCIAKVRLKFIAHFDLNFILGNGFKNVPFPKNYPMSLMFRRYVT